MDEFHWIRVEAEGRLFTLKSKNTEYQIWADPHGLLNHLYWGKAVSQDLRGRLRKMDRGFSGNLYETAADRGYSVDTLPMEYPVGGAGDYRTPALRLALSDGSRSADLRFAGYRLIRGRESLKGLPYVRAGEETETLEIGLRDVAGAFSVLLRYSVWPEEDAVIRSAEIINDGSAPLILEKAASAALDGLRGPNSLLHFHGRHAAERTPERLPVPHGNLALGSQRGMSSHHENPFVILCGEETGEDAGECWGSMLVYSGNHLEEAGLDQANSLRFVTGIHPTGFSWHLAPGESFQTPETILIFSDGGFNGLSGQYHRLLNRYVLPENPMGHPVLLNSWEACYFNFDAEKILALAEEAKGLGMDLLVLDDGWFGRRESDNSSLGDWKTNEEKLGCSLRELSERIHEKGLQFGLWVEPEMISENSDLFRTHPEWAIREPGRAPIIARQQLVLDMANPQVVDYLFETLSALVDEGKVEYIKWDFNRSVCNWYSHALPAERQGEAPHRFMLGTYDLLFRLREKYPALLIEGCSGGGGRFDAGMLFFSPQIWCSDNTDPIDRLTIQKGTSYGYPIRSMGAHVSASPNHQSGRTTPLRARGAVAMAGTFGYELDPGKLSTEEKEEIKAQIAAYREQTDLIDRGSYYRLTLREGAFGWMLVSPERDEARVTVVCREPEANGRFLYARLRGLDPERVYREESMGLLWTGAALMYAGVTLPEPMGDYPVYTLHLRAEA